MRLHNRQLKAEFWNDPELLQWPREKRWFYMGLVQLADDSGCVENNAFAFKINLFPSPADADITIELIATWVDELIRAGKLVPYTVQGKEYLFIKNFHKHQSLNKPTPPNKTSVPLPPWITWQPGDKRSSSRYVVSPPQGDGQPLPGSAPDVSSQCLDTSQAQPSHVPPELEKEKEKELELYNTSAYADGGGAARTENPPDNQPSNVVALPELSTEARGVVLHLHRRLEEHGVNHLPRDWHLKQYSVTARIIKSGVSPGELMRCIDWLFADSYWRDKIADMLAVERQYPRFKLAQGGARDGIASDLARRGDAQSKSTLSQYDSVWACAETGG
jgi:hypothetical protein